MPGALDRGDRKLLLGAAGVLLLLIVLGFAFSPPGRQSSGYPSSYSAASDGAKAAYLLLKETDQPVERWEQSPTELPDDAAGDVLVLADPFVQGSREEHAALDRFLLRGGRVVAVGMAASGFVPEGSAETGDLMRVEWEKFDARTPSGLTRGAPQISLVPSSHWGMHRARHIPLYGRDGQVVAVAYPVGKGEVVWWASATPLTNAGLQQPGNLEFFLDSVAPPGVRRIFWDEYFHGQRRSLWSFAAETPLPWGLAQLGVLALAVGATFSRRSGPVRMPRQEARLDPLEFVETLGGLYQRAQAAPVAVEIAYTHFRFLLTRRLGLPLQSPPAELERAVRNRLGWKQPGLAAALERAEQAMADPDLTEQQAVPVVRALRGYARAFGLTSTAPKGESGWRQ